MSTKRMLGIAVAVVTLPWAAMSATIVAAKSGVWSDTTTWTGGIVPSTNDTAQVSAGYTVTVDVPTVTVYQVKFRSSGVFKMDGSAATGDSMSHTLRFSDAAGAGFIHNGLGTCILRGDATHTQYVTTTASGAPANYWSISTTASGTSGVDLDWDYTAFSYFQNPQGGTDPSIYIDHCTFSHSKDKCFFYTGPSVKSYANNVLEYNRDAGGTGFEYDAFYGNRPGAIIPFTNMVIRNADTTYHQVYIYGHDNLAKWEFKDSNFDIGMTSTGTYLRTYDFANTLCALVSQNHNDVPDDYRLILGNTLAETNLFLKFDEQNLHYTATVSMYLGGPYYNATLRVDRAIVVKSLSMDSKCYLDLSAGSNLYYRTTASYTPANVIGPGQVLKIPTGSVIAFR
jgi:hypothetical protein